MHVPEKKQPQTDETAREREMEEGARNTQGKKSVVKCMTEEKGMNEKKDEGEAFIH